MKLGQFHFNKVGQYFSIVGKKKFAVKVNESVAFQERKFMSECQLDLYFRDKLKDVASRNGNLYDEFWSDK